MKLTDLQKQTIAKLKNLDQDIDLFWNAETGAAKFVKGTMSKPSSDEPESIARAFLEDNPGLLDLQQGLNETLEVAHIESDKQGFSHVSLSQTLNGIPVFEGSTQVHINSVGEVVAYKDYRLAELPVSTEPAIAEQEAMATVVTDIGGDSAGIEDSKQRLILFRDANKHTHLAWEIEWLAQGELAASLHLVDAHSGEILLKHTRKRGAVSRLTYSAENATNLRAKLVIEDDQSTSDDIARAAHDHAEMVYDYFLNTFERNSYDGHGADLVSTVHYKQNYNNAFWTDWYEQMVYGDGDGTRFDPLALALDVVGHELSHAVSSRTARFVYAEEAGALDESFADFFGVMVSNTGEITDWKMGEGVYTPYRSGDALRDLSDPTRHNQPDHMNDFLALALGEQPDPDKNDNGYVHSNSGIPNKAAYLTVAGGTHHGIAVEGIGREKAEQVYYLAMTSYLASATDSRWTFMQARYALLNACRQLYGDGGSEYAAIKNAWAAVGVGEPAASYSIIRREASPYLAIPDNRPAGVASVLRIAEQGLIKDMYIGLVIEHTYIGDLRVVLNSPAGESVVLHDRQGGSSNDITIAYDLASYSDLRRFVGDRVQGDWSLAVSDHAAIDTGKLIYWELEFSVQKVEKKTLAREASRGRQIPDNNPQGIETSIELQESGRLVRLDVAVDITHTWIGDLQVVLVSPSGVDIMLHDKSGRSRKNINQTYSTVTDERMQALVETEINGAWRLRVIDTYARDVGRLNSWGLNCVYE